MSGLCGCPYSGKPVLSLEISWEFQNQYVGVLLTSSGLYNCSLQLHTLFWARVLVRSLWSIPLHFQIYFHIPYSMALSGPVQHSPPQCSLCWLRKDTMSTITNKLKLQMPHPHPSTTFVFHLCFPLNITYPFSLPS